MATDLTMEPMLEVFIYESTFLLEQLDDILLRSEKSRRIFGESIDEIFRIMHTVKGSAAMMEFNGISLAAHAAEDVFAILRGQPQLLLESDDELFDLVFECSDFLKEEIAEVQKNGRPVHDPQDLIARLRAKAACLGGEEPNAAPQPEAAAKEALPTRGECRIRVHFEEESQMEHLRAFMLLNRLQDLCDTLESHPAHPEQNPACAATIIEDGLTVSFSPASALSEVIRVVEDSISVKYYELLSMQDEPCEGRDEASCGPESAESENGAPDAAPTQARQSLLSVNQVKVDHLMDLVGELVTAESMLASSPELRSLRLDSFHKTSRELRKLTNELQDVVMSIRMVPLSGVFQKMTRIVRDMSRHLGKEVDLSALGGDTEVDKTINESIGDPLMHMVRNAMDHGIEPAEQRRRAGKNAVGHIALEAKNVGGEIVITVSDDGAGLDRAAILKKAAAAGLLTRPESDYSDAEAYELIMLPGFSTNTEVTEYSGRGVGMDVVRRNIERIGGTLSIGSTPGRGTTFIIKIPLTLAIVDGMGVAVGDMNFTLPITSIRQSFKMSEQTQLVKNTNGAEMILTRGEFYPLIRLHRALDVPGAVDDLGEGILIQVENGQRMACLLADRLLGEQQVVVKPFPSYLSRFGLKQLGLSGCSVLGDGSISLILDANGLLGA